MIHPDFVAEFETLCAKHGLGFDDALEALADAVREDRMRQTDTLIRILLDAAADDLDFAAFNIYASYK